MNLFEVFTGLEVKKNVERAFSDVEVEKVRLCKSKSKVTIFLDSPHVIEYKDFKTMEEEIEAQFFVHSGNKVILNVNYSLSSLYNPESLWNMAKGSLLDELNSISKMNNMFIDNADISFQKDESGNYTMVITSEDTFIWWKYSRKDIVLT